MVWGEKLILTSMPGRVAAEAENVVSRYSYKKSA
jgi:hypothetical protein